jgi:hypothetical protein
MMFLWICVSVAHSQALPDKHKVKIAARLKSFGFSLGNRCARRLEK